MNFKVNLIGLKEAISGLDKIEKKLVDEAYEKSIKDLGEKVGEITQDKVPHDKGYLKQQFVITKVNGSWVCGYNAEYAAYQHEGRDKNGKRIIRNRPGGGQTHYLSEPVANNQRQLLEYFRERFKYHLEKSKI